MKRRNARKEDFSIHRMQALKTMSFCKLANRTKSTRLSWNLSSRLEEQAAQSP